MYVNDLIGFEYIVVLYHLFVELENVAMYGYKNVQCKILKQNQNILQMICVRTIVTLVCLFDESESSSS